MMVMVKGLKVVLCSLLFLLSTIFFSIKLKVCYSYWPIRRLCVFLCSVDANEGSMRVNRYIVSFLFYFKCVSCGVSLRTFCLCFGCVEWNYGNAEFLGDIVSGLIYTGLKI